MTDSALQPVALTSPPEVFRDEFVKIASREAPSPLWHFELALHKTCRTAPPSKAVPPPGGDPVPLGLFNRPDPPCDIELLGMHVPFEIDPADWLDAWIQAQPVTVVSRLRVPTLSGAVGDLVIRWEVNGAPWMGRIVALKSGPRVVVIWFRTAAADYPKLAESMLLTISSFRFLDGSTGPLAEQVRWAEAKLPVAWRVALPSSWEIQVEPGSEHAASLQATLLDPQSRNPLGKLSLAVISPVVAPSLTAVLEGMRAALVQGGITIPPLTPQPQPAAPPYLEHWHTVASASIDGRAAEIHARVLKHPRAWVAALVITPARALAPALWMRNKRLLDIATSTLEFQ